MKFTKKQMTAIYLLTREMASADGKIDVREPFLTSTQIVKLGFTAEEGDKIVSDSESMKSSEAISIVSDLAYEGKKYVAALLTTLMAIDGEVAKPEVAMLALISTLCKLPIFNTVGEAVDYIRA